MDKITWENMEILIKKGEAKILKKSQRKNNKNLYRYLVEYKEDQYLLCNTCDCYLKVDSFTSVKEGRNRLANKMGDCKECRSKATCKEYHADFIRHLHYRYGSVKNSSKKYNVPCLSFEEFVDFAKTVKEPIYGLTLEEAFDKNMAGEFEIEHKEPISKGGTSLLDNLFLSYKPFNRLRGVMTIEQAIDFARLIVQHEDIIKKSYDI